MTKRFDSKDPAEKVVLTFDFSDELAAGETLSGPITVSVSVAFGTDPMPGDIINGSAAYDGDQLTVMQPVHGGVNGCDYYIKAVAGTTNPNKTLARAGILPVRNH